MIRGIERRKIFRDNKDREDFLDGLGKLLPETQTYCYTWALIPNHALCGAPHKKMIRQQRPCITGNVGFGNEILKTG
jgi:hypothetical protein